MSGNGNPNRRPPPMTGNGSFYRHQQMSNGNHHSSNYHKQHSYMGGYNNYSSHSQNRSIHGQGGRGGHNSYNNYNQVQGYGNHYGHPGMYNSNINSNSNSSINSSHSSNTNVSSRSVDPSKKQNSPHDNNSTNLLSSRRQHTKNGNFNSVNSHSSSSSERSIRSPQSNGSYSNNSANNEQLRNSVPTSSIDIKNESDSKYNNNIKKALDINSLQPMKKPSKVKEERKEKVEDEEKQKREEEDEKKKGDKKVLNGMNIEKCLAVDSKQDTNRSSDVTNIKIEYRTSEEEKVDGKKVEENSDILTQPAESTNDNEESIADDEEDEKPILNGKKKLGSAEPSSQAGTQNESEGDTDMEESIPLPSKKTRRLHRLMRKTNSDNESNDDEPNNKLTNFKPQKRRVSSASQSSRSQSPKARKVSSRAGKDASGRSLLQRVCAKGHYEEAKELIESGVNVNDADYAGITPLHEAALEGFTDLVKLLLDNGADIDVQSGHMDKDTPLIDATSNLHYEVVKLLLQRNANPTLYNAQGDTALDTLDANRDPAEIDDEDLSTIKKLKKLLAQATREFRKKSKHYNQQNNDGTSDSEDMDSLSRRQNNNTFYDLVTREGRSGIYSKVAENDVTFVLNYVSNLSGSNIPPDLLTIASKHGHTDIASLLIAFGGNANYIDKKGLTPLMYAVGKDHTDMVKLLLQNQADVTIRDKQGRTALDILMESDIPDEDEMKLLKDKLSNPAIQNGNEMEVDKEDSDIGSKKNKSSRNKLKRKRVIESNDEEQQVEEDNEQDDKGDIKSINVFTETKLKKKKKKKSSEDMNNSSSMSSLSSEKMPITQQRKDVDVDSSKENSVSAKSGKSDENTYSSSVDKVEKKENDEIAEDDKKFIETTVKETPVLTQEEMEAKVEKERKEIEVKRLKQLEESEARKEKELEEIEAKKEKELEAKKAREALEQERLERKRLKQEKIAKSIEEFEKKREAEKKAAELQELEKKRRKENERAKKLEEDRERKRIEMEKQDFERRKLIRSFYPYGLQIAKFKKSESKEDILKYLPLYCFTINCECFIIDIQLNLILGIEDLYSCYPTLQKTKIKYEEKPHIWNLLWPMIGSFVKNEGSIEEMKKRYEFEENNFKELIVNWVRFSEFEDILNKNKELEFVRDAVKEIGICNVEIPDTVTTDLKSKELSSTESSANIIMPLPISEPDSENKEFPLHFGKKAKHAMEFINKRLW